MRRLLALTVLGALLAGCGPRALPDYTVVAKNIYLDSSRSGGKVAGYYVTIVMGGVDRETYIGDYFATGFDGAANGNPCFERSKIGSILAKECR